MILPTSKMSLASLTLLDVMPNNTFHRSRGPRGLVYDRGWLGLVGSSLEGELRPVGMPSEIAGYLLQPSKCRYNRELVLRRA